MKPVQIKDIKEGDILFESEGVDWGKLITLMDGRFKSTLNAADKRHKQYEVEVINEHNEKVTVLVD